MPSRFNKPADSRWYYVAHRPDGSEDRVPLRDLCPPSDAAQAVLERLIEAVKTEALTRKPQGRPKKPEPCPTCSAVTALLRGNLAGIVAGGGMTALPVAAPAAVAAPVPASWTKKPSEVRDAWLRSREKTHEPSTSSALRCCLNRAIDGLGDEWTAWLPKDDGSGGGGWAWWAILTTKQGTPMVRKAKKNIRNAVQQALAWARRVPKWHLAVQARCGGQRDRRWKPREILPLWLSCAWCEVAKQRWLQMPLPR